MLANGHTCWNPSETKISSSVLYESDSAFRSIFVKQSTTFIPTRIEVLKESFQIFLTVIFCYIDKVCPSTSSGATVCPQTASLASVTEEICNNFGCCFLNLNCYSKQETFTGKKRL